MALGIEVCPPPGFNAESVDDSLRLFEQLGVLVARGALDAESLRAVRSWSAAWGCANQGRLDAGDTDPELRNWQTGGGNLPRTCVLGGVGFVAPIVLLVVTSPLWSLVERIIGSNDLVISLHYHRLRRMFDDLQTAAPRNSYLHQDTVLVNPGLPITMWIPLQDIPLSRASGLGFAVGHFDEAFGYPIPDDVCDRVLANFWEPEYALGDVAIFGRYTPHLTTIHDSRTERYSIEVRVCPVETTPLHVPEFVHVVRQDGSLSLTLHGMNGTPYAQTFGDLSRQPTFVLPPPPT